MKLVIVESPTKARKLKAYLGEDYQVEASVGHVRDLPKSKLGVDLEKNFEPTYVVPEGKEAVVKSLQKLAKKATAIYLAMDPDREGEAIAWHIKHLLQEKKIKKDFLRATFNEITQSAVLKAIEKPGKLNLSLVNAQQARRVVDRLVGYQVSPVLWKKVRRGLSAGRVQSVALRLIVEREKEIGKFKPDEYWEVDVALDTDLKSTAQVKGGKFFVEGKPIEELPPDIFIARVIKVEGKKYEPKSEKDVKTVVSDLEKSSYQVRQVERKERRRSSLPPFITSTLQQAAATRLGFTARQTMSAAQQLYEEGLITYHRTDSVNLSQQSRKMARDYIAQTFGKEYLPEKERVFARKSKGAQEAHEAIRVTDVRVKAGQIKERGRRLAPRHERVYDLIWKRFLASQMSAAVYDQTSILVRAETLSKASKNKAQYDLRTSGSTLKFAGWMKLFTPKGDVVLPSVEEGQLLNYRELNAAQKFTLPPPRYNDASLIKELEKRGIGRPSTYASIISVIVYRGYVSREQRRFTATAVGITVSDFLIKHFPDFMEYDFTAEMEEDLDRIARGEKEWQKVVKAFYTPLSKKIEDVTENAERVKIPVEKTGETCPDCGSTEGGEVVIRTGRFGKFKSCSRFPDCKYTQNIVEKLEGHSCPLCSKGDVIIRKSRWGKPFYGCSRYPECDWASWKKPEEGLKVTQKEWAKMQAERKARAAKRKKGKKTKYSSKNK